MPLDIQSSDFLGRLRRAFGIRGAGSTPSIDENISSVAQAYDLDAPPFRLDGFGVCVGAEVAALAANLSAIEFTNQMPQGARTSLVINQLGLYNTGAAAVTAVIGYRAGLLGASRIARTGEQAQPPAGVLSAGVSDFFSLLPVEAAAQNRPATGLSASATQVVVPASSTIVIPLGLVIGPTQTLVVESVAVNVPLGAFIIGRYFQNYG